MQIGAVADIHGNFDALTQAMERHPEVRLWICVGDLASRTGAYPEPPTPLYWIKGNNEDFDRIAAWQAGEPAPRHLHYLANGTATRVGPLTVAGLGGTFAPTWYDTPAAALPPGRRKVGPYQADLKVRLYVRNGGQRKADGRGRLHVGPGGAPAADDPESVRRGGPSGPPTDAIRPPADDKRRHFVREEAEACAALRGVDILMTHEAARPFVIVDEATPGAVPRRRDAGKPAINAVLAAMQPRLHLCGHHHRFLETVREGVPSVCIDRINRSYLLIDAETLAWQKIDQ